MQRTHARTLPRETEGQGQGWPHCLKEEDTEAADGGEEKKENRTEELHHFAIFFLRNRVLFSGHAMWHVRS